MKSLKTTVCQLTLTGLLAVVGVTGTVDAQEAERKAQPEPTPEQLKFFETKIRPVLITECYRCHSQQTGKIEGSLRVDNAQSLLLGGDSGPAVDVADFEAGTLWQAINYDGIEMPPGRPLSQSVIDDFEIWLKQGAPDPRKLELEQAPSTVSEEDIEKGRQFWSFQPVKKVSVPETDSEWAKSPIDHFLVEKWQQNQLPEPGDAESTVMLRRLCFDLIGVPPTSEQIAWFEELWEKSPESAIESAADRLLASEKFGERWGRHWLDIARYAESTGKEVNSTYPHAWRYRDYVIDSFNEDKPYDRFLEEQLAGDLLPVRSDKQWSENLIATGFLTLGPKTLIERSERQFQADLIDEQIDVTTRSILGVSVACARCHDHKFEAITQRDYYAMAGIFSNMETYYGGTAGRQNRNNSRLIELPVQDSSVVDFSLTAEEIEMVREQIKSIDDEIADLSRPAAGRRGTDRRSSSSDSSSNESQNRQAMDQQQRRQMIIRLSVNRSALQSALESLDENGRPISVCMGVQPKRNPQDAKLLARGEVDQPGESVPRGFVEVLDKSPPRIAKDSSGRLELAQWIASDKNPLTSRVMANRIWLHLMGNGIVRTPEDFGVTGRQPSHPELLDYLAKSFTQNKWSVKSLIREIVTSRAYRMSSDYQSYAANIDPENQLFWRREPQQLEAESLRDTMLMVSGELQTERPRGSIVAQVGPAVFGRPAASQEIVNRLQQMKSETDGDSRGSGMMRGGAMQQAIRAAATRLSDTTLNRDLPYRSVYLPIVRDHVPRSLDLFDFAEPSMVVGDRDQSQTAPQALYMMNSDFVWEQSVAMAAKAESVSEQLDEQLNWIFRTSYSRDATAEEIELAKAYLESQTKKSVKTEASEADARRSRRRRLREVVSQPQISPMALLCQGIMASAEFRFVY